MLCQTSKNVTLWQDDYLNYVFEIDARHLREDVTVFLLIGCIYLA